jgi:hypothetical protein
MTFRQRTRWDYQTKETEFAARRRRTARWLERATFFALGWLTANIFLTL